MEKCKYCQAELEENNPVCPVCGKDQQEEAQQMPETQATADQEQKRNSPGRTSILVTVIVLALAALAGMLFIRFDVPEVVPETAPQITAPQDAEEPTDLLATEATVPADGNPGDVTCKGSYTADDETVIAAGDTVVATMGDATLTVSQLQVYYWMEVRNFLTNLYYYGVDGTYYGMSYDLGLDYQSCSIASGMTWQQFFLESALGSWSNYQSLALEAQKAGYEMDAAAREEIETTPETLRIQAESNGFADAQALLAYNVGNCADMEDYLHFLELYHMGAGYYNDFSAKQIPTDEEVEAFFTENEEAYAANGLTRDTRSVDVRHILVFPEGADNSNIRTETFSEEAWAAGEKQAQQILDTWLAGEMTEESFAALANEKSADPGSNTNGGLYTEVMQGDMVPEFDAWCFDPERQVGDYAIVRTSLGFHIMYFSGSNSLWQTYARQDWAAEKAQAMLDAALEAHPIEVDYSTIVLGYVDIAG